MADKKHEEQPKGPQAGGAQQGPPPKQESQKSQIAQYFKSQGRQPDDVVWSIGGLNLTLKDLD